MVSGVIDAGFKNIYLIVIGRFFPVATLGYYQNAQKLVDMPTKTIATVLKNVTFSAFSSIQDDNIRLKKGYKMIIQQIFFWLCPILIFTAILAKPLFSLVLTDKWLPAVPFFQMLCIVGIIYPLQAYNLEIVNVKGRSDIFLKLEVFKKILLVIGVVVAIPYGIWVLVGFQVFSSFVNYFINSHFSGKFIQYTTWEQLKDIAPVVFLTAIVGGGIYIVNIWILSTSDWIQLLVGYGIGIILYGILAHLIKLTPYRDFRGILKEHKHRLPFNRKAV